MMFNKISISAVCIVALLFPPYLQADEYLLAMSKDDPVCQQMRALYNKDLKQHGKVIFENHSEYNWLEWDEDISIFDAYGHKSNDSYNTAKLAVFDINNDAKDETVIFQRSSLSSTLRDYLDIYPFSVSQNRNSLHWPELNNISYVTLSGGGGLMSLRSSLLQDKKH